MEAVDYCYYKGSIVLCSSVVISAFISKTLNATPFKEKKQLKKELHWSITTQMEEQRCYKFCSLIYIELLFGIGHITDQTGVL